MKKQMHRLLSLMLSLILVVGLIPGTMTAYAATGGANLSQLQVGGSTITRVDEKLDFFETRGFIYDGTLSHPTLYLYNYTGGAIKFYQNDDSNKNISIDVIVKGNCTINGDLLASFENNVVAGVYTLNVYLEPGATLNINGQVKANCASAPDCVINFMQRYKTTSEHKSVVNIVNEGPACFYNMSATSSDVSVYNNIEFNATSTEQTIKNLNIFINSPARATLKSKGEYYWIGTNEDYCLTRIAANCYGAAYDAVSTVVGGYNVGTFAPKITTHVSGITLNNSSYTIEVGQSINTLAATVTPAEATNKNVTWSSSDPSVATVNQAGFITGIKEGTATITAKTDDGGYTATCTVTVEKAAETIKVTSITLDPTSIDMKVGDARFFPQVAVSPADATNKNVTWSSSDTSVFTVDEANGFIEAVGSGSAKLIATAADGSGVNAECTVTVTEAQIDQVSVNFTVPSAGDSASAAPVYSIPGGAEYEMMTDGAVWREETGTYNFTDTFEAGKTYSAVFFLRTDGTFADSVTATINDGALTGTATKDGTMLKVIVPFTIPAATPTPTEIDAVSVNFTVPSAGDSASVAPVYSIPGGAEYEMMTDGAVWREETGTYNFTDTFEAGKTYSAVFFLRTDGTFADSVTATINDGALTGTATKDGTMLKVIVPFTIPAATPTPTEYDITVTGGTASVGAGTPVEKATAGTVITLTVDESAIPAGKVFDKWEVVSGGVTVADGKFTMSANAVEIRATYKDAPVIPTEYDITVTGGTASANKAVAGTVITLTVDESAIPAGKVFDKWEVVSGGVTVADGKFTMPESAVEIKATYKDAPVVPTEYDITVTGGTASANKAVAGTVITLTVDESAIPAGKVFDKWEVVSGGVTVTDGKFTMPESAVEIKATYKDAPVSHTCDIKPVAKDEPSCTEGGKEAYYKCEGCGKFYEDALGAKEITDLANWGNLPKLGHTESDWKSDKDNHWKECTVTACGVIIEDSKAAHKDDNKDGKCDVCEYNVGLPTTPDDDKPNDNPQTGDNSNMFLWIALLFISGAGVVATTVFGKKKFSVK